MSTYIGAVLRIPAAPADAAAYCASRLDVHTDVADVLADVRVEDALHVEATLPIGQQPRLLAMIPAESRRRWWLRSACASRSSAATAILLIASVGQDGRETPRTFLDEERFLPILI